MSTMPPSDAALSTSALTKVYNVPRSKQKKIAVDNLDLTVPRGDIFGFLGPNGAGKTTTIKMLLSFVEPTSGSASIFGELVDNESSRKSVGYVPEQPYFPKFLTCQELIRSNGVMSGLSSRDARAGADRCLEMVGMPEVRHLPLSQLSKGMTQRIGLACALVGDPKLLILDEPSSGLDPVGRRELRALLVQFKEAGKTIFLSSHLLSEMESVCDNVAVMARGKLVACGAPAQIVRASDSVAIAYDASPDDEVIPEQINLWGGRLVNIESRRSAGARTAVVPNRYLYSTIDLLQQRKAVLQSVTPDSESPEDAFLRLVGEAA